jgi:hypothetical protein
MVQITPEEVMDKRRKAAVFDEMPAWKRQLIGASGRVQIPFDDVHLIRKVAPLLAGLAESLAFTSRRTDLDEYNQLMAIKNEIAAVNNQIRLMHGGAYKNGTYPRVKDDR